jgi:cytochrome c oxidase assembly protein subunit 15
MSLSEFKRIYWWEWGHRELGRFIGLVYLAGFIWIAVRRAVPPRALAALTGLGLLLGGQGSWAGSWSHPGCSRE